MFFSFHGEVKGKECHGSRDLRTSNGGSKLCGDDELSWCFGTCSSGMEVGVTTQEKFNVLPFRVKIQGMALIDSAWR